MSTTPSTPPRVAASGESPASPTVAAVVLFVDEEGIDAVLDSVGRQVYETRSVVIVGGGEVGAAVAGERGAEHVASFIDLVNDLSPDIDLIWLVHGDARPRPDALGALVAELERNDASVMGSKILDGDHPERLESVGSATDVFGEPYSGLDPDEVDLEQYDVVRDVAFVSGVSVLVRRDLIRGLRGIDPLLPPVAAGMDLSQRARIAGGRVMVAPSSEVLHHRRCGHEVEGWRELAGRMRAMLKAYRLITLLWVVPLGFLVGMLDGVGRLFLGRVRPLVDVLLAGGWNLLHLPSTLGARRALRSVRSTGDEELFRYQVNGSMRMRALGTDIGERLGWVLDEEPAVVDEDDLEEEARRPGPVVAALGLVVLALAARRLWFGPLPSSGFSLPPSEDSLSVLETYAGGWNPSGLGSAAGLHPAPAAVAAARLLLGDLAVPVLTAASMLLGFFGISRLLRRLGVAGPSRHLAGLVLLLGPFALRLGEASHWSGMVAVGALPWLVDAVLAPWPEGWRRRLGRASAIVLTASLAAAFAPVAALIPLVAAAAGAALLPGIRITALLRGALAAAAGGLAAAPYLATLDREDLVTGGPFVEVWPGIPAVAALAVAALLPVAAAPHPHARVAAWGGALSGAAVAAAAAPPFAGEAAVAVVLLGSLGSAVAVGAALSVDTARPRPLLALQAAGSAVAAVVVLSTLLLVPQGRAGLSADEWSGRLEFVASLSSEGGPGRVLLAGDPASLPGESRLGNGYAYRVIWGDEPTLDQAWLAEPLPGDDALAQALSAIDRADLVRPGEVLAPFAIGWVVVLDDAALADSLQAQVDMAEVPLEPGMRVFRNLSVRPRAEASDGSSWTAERVGARGRPGEGTVRLADNAHPSWEPGWEPDGWANRLSAETGEVGFRPDRIRRLLALAAAGLVVLGGVGVAAGRRWWR